MGLLQKRMNHPRRLTWGLIVPKGKGGGPGAMLRGELVSVKQRGEGRMDDDYDYDDRKLILVKKAIRLKWVICIGV